MQLPKLSTRPSGQNFSLLTLIALLTGFSQPLFSASNSPLEKVTTLVETEIESSVKGRHIYFDGEKHNGESITANVGAASIPVPATALPCAGCHGRDGKGRAEGGVKPTNITWSNLSKPYGGRTDLGRRYKAYDENAFLMAITEGVDSSGNKLDSSMPRFNVSRQDAANIVSYLKVIQDDDDPGVSRDELVIGTLQPDLPYQQKAAEAMVAVIRAQFDDVNRHGGIYGRQLRLQVASYEGRQSFIGQANKMINDNQVFALVCAFSASADEDLTMLAEKAHMPSVGPYTQFPFGQGGQHQYTFYLQGGLDTQIAVLAKRSAETLVSKGPAFVFFQQDGGFEANAKKAVEYLYENKVAQVSLIPFQAGESRRLADFIDLAKNPNPFLVFLGAAGELVNILSQPLDETQIPHVFLPEYFVTSDILKLSADTARQLEMAYINVPDSNQGAALSDFRQFMRRHKLDHDYLTLRLFAYSASRTLIEGVKRSGKRITRDQLVSEIENMYGFEAGLNKPLNFGSRRRTGILGAYVVKLDSESGRLSPTDIWVRLD